MLVRTVTISLAALALSACGQPAEEGNPDSANKASVPVNVVADPLAEGARPKSFAQCAVCHSVEPDKNGIGPTLAGVFGAEAGHIGDFAYSSAMRESELTWDEATLDRYLENPRKTVPNTKMSYNGMRDPAKRAEMIEYLKGL